MPVPPIEALLPASLEDPDADGAVSREDPAPAAAVPGSFRGIPDADFRGSRLLVAPPDVASSTADAAESTAAAAAAAALACLAVKPLPPIVARKFSRPARAPAPAPMPERLEEALRGDTPPLGFVRAAAAAAAAAMAPLPRPLSKLSSLSAPPPPPPRPAPALSLAVRARAAPSEGRGEVEPEEEGRGDKDFLAGCGDAFPCFCCCAASLARREAADTPAPVVVRREMRLRGAGICSAADDDVPFFEDGDVFLDAPPDWDKRGDRTVLSGGGCCCCGDGGEAAAGTTTAGGGSAAVVGLATPWTSTRRRFRAPTGIPIWSRVRKLIAPLGAFVKYTMNAN